VFKAPVNGRLRLKSGLISKPARILVTVWALAIAATLVACGARADADPREDAIAAAHEAGLVPYWLGQRLVVNGARVVATSKTYYGPDRPQFSSYYRLATGGSGLVVIQTYPDSADDWKTYLDALRRAPNTLIKPTRFGPWSGELWSIPSPPRPVNTLAYVLHVDDMVVIATAKAVSTGVPGTDLNPLIDAKLWGEVLEEHLQPYPRS
jgi:hypothetical protein